MCLYLVDSVISGMMYPPVALVAWPALALAFSARSMTEEKFRRRELLLLIGFVVPVLLILYGAIFATDERGVSAQAWRSQIPLALICLPLLMTVCVVIKLRGMRFIAISLGIFQMCLTLILALEATMAVINVWL